MSPKIPSTNKQQQEALGKIIKGVGSAIKPAADIALRVLKKSANAKKLQKKGPSTEDTISALEARDAKFRNAFTKPR